MKVNELQIDDLIAKEGESPVQVKGFDEVFERTVKVYPIKGGSTGPVYIDNELIESKFTKVKR